MTGPLDQSASERLLRAIFGDREITPACPQCGGPCPVIGGCWSCGARPFCQAIGEDGICVRCGADQDGPPDLHGTGGGEGKP